MNLVKNTIIFSLGCATGAVGMYYYLSNKLKKEFEIKLQHDLDESLDILTNTSKEEPEHVEKTVYEEKNGEVVNEYMETYSSLSSLYKQKDKDEPDWAKAPCPVEKSNAHLKEYKKPYIIDEETHWEMEPSYDMVEVTYDPHEGQVYDENGDLMDDVDQKIGIDNLETLIGNERGEIIVRNDYLNLDFNVFIEDPK